MRVFGFEGDGLDVKLEGGGACEGGGEQGFVVAAGEEGC
jgi:hypothetical protein